MSKQKNTRNKELWDTKYLGVFVVTTLLAQEDFSSIEGIGESIF